MNKPETNKENMFANLKHLIARWRVIERRELTEAELAAIISVDVQCRQWGYAAIFNLCTGDSSEVYISSSCNVTPGDTLDPRDIIVVALTHDDDMIFRIELKNK